MRAFFRIIIIKACVIFTLNSWAQDGSEYYYQNAVFSDEIKTVQAFREGFELSHPIYELGAEANLIFKFDDLQGEAQNYYYTIVHCDADWHESFLLQNDYLNGFYENQVDDYAFSFNTTMTYINYLIRIPNEQVQITQSGNYALVVYEDQDKEKLVLTRRFQVLQPKVRISGRVKRATFDPFKGDNQEVDFTIYHENLNLINPREEVKVVVMKNRRWDTAIRDLKPLFIRENELVYDYDQENVFPGGNEYRYFDIRTRKYNGENVEAFSFFRPYYHVTLLTDQLRSNQKYFGYKEMNGNFVVESQDRVDDYDTECDYFFVHFTLPLETQLVGGTVNVMGALTDWNANKSNEMSWNYDQTAYELTLLLKQGYYNYQYVYVSEGSQMADASVIEGSHYETENEYQVFVYYRGMSGRFDQLVGYQLLKADF
ncbi:type IX secretion system plug protein [Sunxiuqinia sp. sy24]|uniref:type IX secretion system plug protein n=1 Tax=Sunxiuqinia sp. sy24 TaxID=3461495 RepID=UPI00404594EF